VKLAGGVPGVEEEEEGVVPSLPVNEDGEGAGFLRLPIDRFLRPAIGTQPADIGQAGLVDGTAGEKAVAPEGGELAPQPEEPPDKVARLDGLGPVVPGNPAELVVLAIAVVVPLLGAQAFVAGEQERHALGTEEGGEKVPDLPPPQGQDRGILRRALGPVVVGDVVRVAVGVPFPVGEIVLVVVADKVEQGEAIVRGDEVHARRWGSEVVREKILAPGDAGGEFPGDAGVAPPETPHPVAVFSIQLGPIDGKIADLVTSVSEVPGFRDELHPREHRVLVHRLEKGGAPLVAVPRAAQLDGQVEAEPVHVHLLHPVAKAVHDEAQGPGMGEIEGVPAAGVVEVMTGLGGIVVVIGEVVEPAEEAGGAVRAALAGVIVDDVEDDLDPGTVKSPDHVAELPDRVAGRGVSRLGGEKAEGVVSPVVDEAPLEEETVVEMLVHREKLHGGDSQVLQIPGRGGVRQARVSAAKGIRYVRVPFGKALHMEFEDDRITHGGSRRGIAFPVVNVGRRHECPWGVGAAVDGIHESRIGARAEGGMVARGTVDAPGVGIEEKLVAVEKESGERIPGSVDAIPIGASRRNPRDAEEPGVPVFGGEGEPVGLERRAGWIGEKTEFD